MCENMKNNLFIYTSGTLPIDKIDFEVVERKGIGHPDTLCDTLAEKISVAYSQYCLNHYGVILRHMVDKIALSGGASMVKFGGGEMKKPIKLYLNCRFTRTYQKETIPYFEIVKNVVHKHFKEVLPLLDVEKWLTIVDNTHNAPGPGIVYEADGTTKNERQYFFEVPEKEFAEFHNNGMRSNDTSTTVAYSPLSNIEKIVILFENTLNGDDFKKTYPFIGTDIKVMAKRVKNSVDITACVPFIAEHTPSREFYYEKIEMIENLIKQLIAKKFSQYDISVKINTRDEPNKSDYYLTLTGSAIESGDEGVVGRGNRYNGVIPFTRHMTTEACCGKNPIYHIGKIYTAVGSLISIEIFDKLNLETYVYLTSQIGRDLLNPWSVCVEICDTKINQKQQQIIEKIIEKNLNSIKETTIKIIEEKITLY